MTRRLAWQLLCLLLFGCGRNFSPKQLDQPCTRSSQCDVGLTCLAGVCSPASDAGVDGGADAGP